MTPGRWLLVIAVLATGLAIAWSARPQPRSDAQRVDGIAAELRCPVCQGLSVQDSPSETARAMKDLVAKRVAEGRTDDEIRGEFRRSYGDWILLSPPLLSLSGLVWLAPLAALMAGGILALGRARAPAAAAGPALTPEQGLQLLESFAKEETQ
ncbi:MAG: cytochrome c-type biogenesis protein CcmH [Chloroflexota bacterium]